MMRPHKDATPGWVCGGRTRRRILVKAALQSSQAETLLSGTHCSLPAMMAMDVMLGQGI